MLSNRIPHSIAVASFLCGARCLSCKNSHVAFLPPRPPLRRQALFTVDKREVPPFDPPNSPTQKSFSVMRHWSTLWNNSASCCATLLLACLHLCLQWPVSYVYRLSLRTLPAPASHSRFVTPSRFYRFALHFANATMTPAISRYRHLNPSPALEFLTSLSPLRQISSGFHRSHLTLILRRLFAQFKMALALTPTDSG